VYNVPATTGTQLEVYYDAKDLANGAVTSVTDLSPNTNNATLGGDPQVSNGAFVFDGVGDYIRGQLTSFGGEQTFTFSLWFNMVEMVSGSNNSIFQIGSQGSSEEGLGFRVQTGSVFRMYTWGGSASFDVGTVLPKTWYHAVGTYSSGVMTLYVDGNILESRSGSSLNLPTNPYFALGVQLTSSGTEYSTSGFNGSIANFRLYSKALNAGQVQELYDYQKDYFLGSKSQVTLYKGHLGVGVAEPSGQLELAGDARLQEYPPGPMSGYETLIPGHGVFCVSASTFASSSYETYFAFDNNNSTAWLSQPSYDNTTGGYTTSISTVTTGNIDGSGTSSGEWLQISLPSKIFLKRSGWIPQGDTRGPKTGVILGSNDGSEWNTIHSFSGKTYSGTIETELFSGTSSTAYQYFRIIGNTVGAGARLEGREWKLFGTPGPTTLDKGSLTLGRSLDVPRISRYDVDTETPRPEKLVVDFDTTVNSSPTDISGKGNHGAFYNGASYSAADKAFVFDGTNDSIRGIISNPAGDWVHSISFWFKLGIDQSTISSRIDPFTIGRQGTGGVNRTADLPGVDLIGHYSSCDITPTSISWYFYSNDASFSISGIKANEWHHLTLAYEGGGAVASRHAFFDGVEYPNTGTSTAALDMFAGSILALGVDFGRVASSPSYFNGQLSNFKLYNVALEGSEVQKLYRLGRTGRSMVISDTAVGIGKVPEAQLDVRGSARFVHAEATDTIACNSLAYGIGQNLTTPRDHSCLAQRKVIRGNPCVLTFKVNYVSSWVPGILTLTGTSVNTNSSAFQGDHVVVAYRRLSSGDSGTGDIDITVLNGSGSVSTNTGGTGKFNIVYTGTNTSGTQETIEITYSGGGARDVFVAECVEYSRLYY